jgi:cholesterol transport system auxiliary component
MKALAKIVVGGRAAAVLWMALLGCSIGPAQKSAEHTYSLNPAIAPEILFRNPAPISAGTLLISMPKAQPGFDTSRMVYSLRPHELSYYALNRWADTPARMLMGPLLRTLEGSGLWRNVVQMPSTLRADYRLDCDNLLLEQQFSGNSSRVRLALRAQVIDLKRQAVVGSRDLELLEIAPSDDAYGGVIAANRAAAKLLEEIAAWLELTINERVPSAR